MIKKVNKNVWNVLFLVLLIAVTLYAVFHNQDMNLLMQYLKSADIRYWGIGVILVIAFIQGESVIIYYLMKSLGENVKLSHCFLYSYIGFFFCLITPSASGGQPAQLYFMKKEGLSLTVSTMVLMIVTITYKFVLVLVGAAVMIFQPAGIIKYVRPVMGWCYLGMFLNVVCVAAMMILVFHPTLAENMLLALVRLKSRLKIGKKSDRLEKRVHNAMEKYRGVADYFYKHKRIIFNVTCMTIIQRVFLFAVTYVAYRSFSLEKAGITDVIGMQGMISVAVDMLPLPGGLGITEKLFLDIFRPVCGKEAVYPVMIVSRGINYYTQLLISAVMSIMAYYVIVYRVSGNLKEKRMK